MNTNDHCHPKSIALQAVYFKLRFTLSYRDVEEIIKMGNVSDVLVINYYIKQLQIINDLY